MFTGIVEQVGAITARVPRGPGARLAVSSTWRDLELGESISIGGVCLTVDAISDSCFEADASPETLARSTLVHARRGVRVNLERAVKAGQRLGGHIVSGHVDGTARLLERRPYGDAMWLRFELPSDLGRFAAAKGSIAVDGVSLTVNGLHDASFDVVVVPHTLRVTTLAELTTGASVNLEVDVLARYVARQLESRYVARQLTLRSDPTQKDYDEDASILRALRGAGYL